MLGSGPGPNSIQLFGGLQARGPLGTTASFGSHKNRLLLIYLTLHADEAAPRDRLVELLWPESDFDRGRNSLSTALSNVRAALESVGLPAGRIILADRYTVTLDPTACHIPTHAFRHLMANAPTKKELAKARELYRGPICPETYEDWIIEAQQEFEALAEPLKELGAAPSKPPPSASHGDVASAQLVGREKELAEIGRLLVEQEVPLLTLVGPGGYGKTALAHHVSIEGRKTLFVSLLAATDERSFVACVARAVGAPTSAVDLIRVIDYAGHADSQFLILDNFEHLAESCAEVVQGLVEAKPDLRVLVTTRRRLEIAPETVYQVGPLPLGAENSSPETPSAAATLFTRRASRLRPFFRLTKKNIGEVEALVRLLGGIPLAIELAAEKINVFTPAALASRLAGGTGLLDAKRGPVEPRHRKLGAVIEWTFDSLDPAERQCWELLAACPSGMQLESYLKITPDEESLRSLVEGGIVQIDGGERPRITMPVPFQEYARGVTDSSRRRQIEDSLDAHFLRNLEEFWDRYRSPEQAAALEELERELPNVLNTLDRAPTAARIRAIVRSFDFWESSFQVDAAYRRLTGHESVRAELDDDDRLRLHVALAFSRKFLGIPDEAAPADGLPQRSGALVSQATAYLVLHLMVKASVEALRERETASDSPFTKVAFRLAYGTAARETTTHDTAARWFEEAASIAEDSGLPVQAYVGYREAGYLLYRLGLFAQALRHTERAHELEKLRTGQARSAVGIYGRVLTEHLRFEEAEARLDESYRAATVGGYAVLRRYCLLWLARLKLLGGQWESSRDHAMKALVLARETSDFATAVNALHAACEAAVSGGDQGEAQQWLKEARSMNAQPGFLTPYEWSDVCLAKLAALAGQEEQHKDACRRLVSLALDESNRAVLLRFVEAATFHAGCPPAPAATALRLHLCGLATNPAELKTLLPQVLGSVGTSGPDIARGLRLIGLS